MDPVSKRLPQGALLAAVLTALCGVIVVLLVKVNTLADKVNDASAKLTEVLGEVTRMRIEQGAEGQGINALMEKIAAYAPILTEANVAKPDYEAARRQMDAVYRAVQSIGPDAFGPLQARLLKLNPNKDLALQKLLLDAAVRADPERGRQLLARVLQGFHRDVPASSALRWYAGEKLITADKPQAQQLLRGILGYESSRGIDPQRAPQGFTPGAMNNSSGFHNVVGLYLRSEDPQVEETLLKVLGHSEHDLVTIQECVKALGILKSKLASKKIESLYRNPPGIPENPLFQTHCLDALASILGREACPMFSQELKNAKQDLVIKRLQFLMRELGC